jgi:hypothetical protein
VLCALVLVNKKTHVYLVLDLKVSKCSSVTRTNTKFRPESRFVVPEVFNREQDQAGSSYRIVIPQNKERGKKGHQVRARSVD